ncbi:MAG TPA: aspartyl/glutamyl-tRNA amidotransferase subunit C [Thermoanaerobaculia bacterium]|jgi:aspartyl-tRNA(Asn)/glutamyl-tRNA(Gln) amidotransferase subunit C
MASERRAVTLEIVRNVAQLSRLSLPEAELSRWTEQLGRIVSYIDQIEAIPEDAGGDETPDGVPPTPVREDEPRPGYGPEALEGNAPRRFQGFGVVPRVVGGGE